MDGYRLTGVGKQVTGSIKEAIGMVTGDTTTQNVVGGAEDTVRDVVKG